MGSSAVGTLTLDGSPKYYSFVRLTNAQWARAVQDVLRLDTPSGLEQSFQNPVTGTTDFSNNELVLDVNQESWASFQTAAEALADQVTASDATLAKVYSGTDAAGFIQTLGRRVYRRLLTAAEQTNYMNLFGQGASLTGTRSAFAKGASLVIRAMLQSPFFLYRVELGQKGSPLSGYEVATKLSLLLRGTTPNDALLDSAAGPGKLDTADGTATLTNTMLGEPTAATAMRAFHGELYHFDRYAQISKINVSNYNTALNTEFLDISNLFFDKIFAQNLGVREILTSTSGFVGSGTAALYGVPPPASGYVEKDLGSQRVGYFSQAPFLALYGFNAEPDSIHRGVTMNLEVLCAKLGPPAVQLPSIPPLMPGQTNRQRIDTLTSGCGAQCHNQMINPLGFSFDHFDGMGQYRDTENGGLQIDSSGQYDFQSGTKSFANSGELMKILATDSQAHLCYAKKLSSFGLQRDIVMPDTPLLQSLASTSMASGGSIKNMILQLVRSDAFRTHVGGN
jgi:Protein of unknown function (DUF1592)/Protein of unknown function (DUF1588)/Protein of unknown function (DUF1595)/Protein of unknown function (DUF1585)/Protein of unknown function (DUF1587)